MNKTLWLGNIESWMDSYYIKETLKQLGIFPIKITIKAKNGKRGCAFLEFNTQEQAEYILNNFNGKIFNNLELKFNWVRTFEEKYSTPKITKFTVSNSYFNFI